MRDGGWYRWGVFGWGVIWMKGDLGGGWVWIDCCLNGS